MTPLGQSDSPFWDAARVAGCLHGAYADDGPDAFGQRVCAKCEQRVFVTLTAMQFKTTANQIAPGTFPEVD